jgi:hypothetical protein
MTARLAQTKWRSLDTLFNVGTLGSLSDLELMECFRFDRGTAGQEAFRILVERHGPMVLGLCRSRRRLASRLRERGILSALPATAIEPFRLHLPVLPPALVTSTVQHAGWWSSVSRLVAAESAVPASVAALARGVLRSMFLNTCMMLGIASFLAAGELGTVVSAQQRKPPTPAAPSRPIASPAALPLGDLAFPVQPDELPGLQRVPQPFRALIVGHEASGAHQDPEVHHR